MFYLFIFYLFGALRRFQNCTRHITTGSWKGRGNQYIQLGFCTVNCRPTASNYQLSHMRPSWKPNLRASEVGGESVTTLPPWPPQPLYVCLLLFILHIDYFLSDSVMKMTLLLALIKQPIIISIKIIIEMLRLSLYNGLYVIEF